MQDSDPSVTVADAGQGREVTARLGDSGPSSSLGNANLELPEGGRSLGRYLLLAKIGEGGMGEVHRAYDPQLRREVALKLVKTDRADATEQARLLREAQAMAKLSHPPANVLVPRDQRPRVLDFGLARLAGAEEALYGAESPEVAHLINNMAAAQRNLGQHEEALASLQKALRLREANLGSVHLDVALAYQNVGAALSTLEKYEEAQPYFDRGVEIGEQAVGPRHFRMATILWSRGRNHAQLGHHREAAADMRRALAVGLENDRPAGEIGEYRFSLGEALWETGERAAALEEVEKARAAWQLSGLKTTKMDAWLKERQ